MKIEAREIWLKDGEKLVLRSPEPKDAEILLAHLKTVVSESYKTMNQPPGSWDEFPLEDERVILKSSLESKLRFMISAFTASGPERVVGNLGCFANESSPFLRHTARIGMGIISEFHDRGLGTQLIRTAMFEAKANGFKRLELTVRTFNTPGIKLYEKVGFKKVGRLHQVAIIDDVAYDEDLYEFQLADL